MNRIIFSILCVVLIGSRNIQAQNASRAFDDFFAFAWDVNIPMGDKFVDATSFAGGKLEYRKMVSDNISLGIDLSWNSYYEYKPYQTFHLSNSADVTTDLYKYHYTLPMAITAHYYFSSGGMFQPYIGLGLGALYGDPRIWVNIYELSGYNWGFLVRPEVGGILKFDRDADMGILLGARYSYSTNKEEAFNIENLQALGFQLGLVWLY